MLFKDGHFWLFTLEDEIREVAGSPVADWKIPGLTAIPAGTYDVVVTESARFKRRLPLLQHVPGFTGIRIHTLNTAAESEGCIGVGLARDDYRHMILRSAVATELVTSTIEAAQAIGEKVTIRIDLPVAK